MAEKIVEIGDFLEYSREDHGGDIYWYEDAAGNLKHEGVDGVKRRGWRFSGTLNHIVGHPGQPAEQIIAGKDIHIDLCQDLVKHGTCRLVQKANGTVVAGAISAPIPAVSSYAWNNPGVSVAETAEESHD